MVIYSQPEVETQIKNIGMQQQTLSLHSCGPVTAADYLRKENSCFNFDCLLSYMNTNSNVGSSFCPYFSVGRKSESCYAWYCYIK